MGPELPSMELMELGEDVRAAHEEAARVLGRARELNQFYESLGITDSGESVFTPTGSRVIDCWMSCCLKKDCLFYGFVLILCAMALFGIGALVFDHYEAQAVSDLIKVNVTEESVALD